MHTLWSHWKWEPPHWSTTPQAMSLISTEEVCQPRQPNNVQSLQHLRANVIHTWHLAAQQTPKSSDSASTTEDVLVLVQELFPPPDNISSPGQQFFSPAEHSLSQALLSLPESSNGLPWGQPKVLLHSLPELLPHLGFCFSDCQSYSPVSCFRRPLG